MPDSKTQTLRMQLRSRRSLLQQSTWFYYLTGLVGAVWIWHYSRTGSQLLMPLFAAMLAVCAALPIVSRVAEVQFFRRLLFPRKLKTTREGKWFLVLVITIGFSAINSGDNLLYLILAMMLSFIISSGILSENVLKGISVTRLVPRHVFAGETFRMLLKVRNAKRWTSSYSLIFEDPELEKISPLPTASFLFRVGPQGTATVSCNARVDARGIYPLQTLEVATLFPFNFFMKSMERTVRAELVVYPRLRPLVDGYFLAAAAEMDRLSSRSSLPGMKDFHSLREYRHGDNTKWIHWRSSARLSKMVMKTFDIEESTNAVILFNNTLSDPKNPALRAQYETAITMIASMANMFQSRNFSLQFVCEAPGPVPLGQGGLTGAEIQRVYRVLSGLQPAAEPTTPQMLRNLQYSARQKTLVVAVTVEPDPTLERIARQLSGACVFRSLCVADGDAKKVMPD